MEVIKKDSKGEAVKTLQRVLNLKVDGVFGTQTESAVKAYQEAHDLTADGVVGNQTWAALGFATSTTKAVDASVVYNPLSVHITKSSGRPIKYLAIHYTAGSQSRDCCKVIKSVFEKRKASADFAVDDKCMMQFNPDLNNYYCWAVGDKQDTSGGGGSLYGVATNRNTISIEVCSSLKQGCPLKPNHEGYYFTDAAVDNAVRLAKILMKKFNIPIERVVRHYDISGKLCPGVIGWNNGRKYDAKAEKYTAERNTSSEWEKFKARLK